MSRKPTIAVLGASANRAKFSNKCVRAYLEVGYEVFPVHPRETEIEGLKVAARLADVDADLDRISIYLPPLLTMELLPEIAEKGAGKVFFNPGTADHRVLAAAAAAGIHVVSACSILDVGKKPADFPE